MSFAGVHHRNGSHSDDTDHIEEMRSPFEYPVLGLSPSLSDDVSEKGYGSDPFRDSATVSRRESYNEIYETNATTRPPLALGRANGHRTLSDLYDESPSSSPHLRPGRSWMSGSRAESEATLISYRTTPSPLVRFGHSYSCANITVLI